MNTTMNHYAIEFAQRAHLFNKMQSSIDSTRIDIDKNVDVILNSRTTLEGLAKMNCQHSKRILANIIGK